MTLTLSPLDNAIENTSKSVECALKRAQRFEFMMESLREQNRPSLTAIQTILTSPQKHRTTTQRALVHLTLLKTPESIRYLRCLDCKHFEDIEIASFVKIAQAYHRIWADKRQL